MEGPAEPQRGVDANGGVTAVSNPQYDVIPALSWHRSVLNQLHRYALLPC